MVIVCRPAEPKTKLGSALDLVAFVKSGKSPSSSSSLSSLPLPLWSSECSVPSGFFDAPWNLCQLAMPKRSASITSNLGKQSMTIRVQTSAVPEILNDTIGVARLSSRSALAAGRFSDPLKSVKHWLRDRTSAMISSSRSPVLSLACVPGSSRLS